MTQANFSSLATVQILVVEETLPKARRLARLLARLGYPVAAAVTPAGAEADQAALLRAGLILINTRVAGEWDERTAGGQIPALSGTPVVYLLEEHYAAPLPPQLLHNAHGFLTRPMQVQELRLTIEMALYKHRLNGRAQARDARWKTILTTVPGVVTIVDPDGLIQFVSQTAPGFTPADVIGRRLYDFIAPEFQDLVRSSLERACATRQPQVYENCASENVGSIWYENRVGVLQEDGIVVALVIVSTEITERKQAEEALRRSEARLRRIVENLPVAAALREGDHLLFNRAVETITGYGRDEITHLDQWFRVMYGPAAAETRAQYEADRQAGFPLSPVFSLWRKDGQERLVKFTGYCDEHSEIWLLDDITTQRQAEQELKQLYEQARQDAESRAALLREVNHRVGDNLNSILGLLLAEMSHCPAEGRPYVENALSNLGERVNGLLEVHRLLSASQWSPVALSELALCILRSVCRGISPEQLEFTVQTGELQISPRQANTLALILNELVTNTLKHGLPAGKTGRISVRAGQKGDFIELEYHDNGPGFPQAVLDGQHYQVGMYLLGRLVGHTLRGVWMVANDEGAATLIRFRVEEKERT